MADRSPWLDWSWLKVGPLLPTEQARTEYAQQQAQQGPSMADYQAYRQKLRDDANFRDSVQATRGGLPSISAAPQGNPLEQAVDNSYPQGRAPAPFPEKYSDWTVGDMLRNLTEGSEDIYRKARAADQAPAAAVAAATPDGQKPGMVPPARPEMTASVDPASVTADTAAMPDPAVSDDPLAAIRQKQAMVDALYPAMPPQDVGQSSIDAELAKDRDRSNYLAQLAFFSGITQGAGGNWEGVGRGLAAAGQAQSQGFDRYRKALEKKADRAQDATNAKYRYDTAKTDAALQLYTADQNREEKNLSTARQAIKDRQASIDEYFKQRLGVEKGTDFAPGDPAKIDQTLRDWRLSRQHGEIVSSTDVSDK